LSLLFSPLKLRELVIPNRIAMSPMSQYSAVDGVAQAWHMVHLGARAVGGAGIVMTEATAVSPEGRLSPDDLGIWSDRHIDALRPITQCIRSRGAVPGIQLAHGGRKSGRCPPWEGNGPLDEARRWPLIGASAIPFDEGWQVPAEMGQGDIDAVIAAFRMAARRARFPLMVARALREEWPEHLPVFVRISAIDWEAGGVDIDQSVQFAAWLREAGVDLIDCSSGAVVPREQIAIAPGYQVPFAAKIRSQSRIATGAVGLITEARQAEDILAGGNADLVFVARALLRDPYWPHKASEQLDTQSRWPVQYARAVQPPRTAW
jgi:2,4-dienoyl-CoA reductase-like NADH-dependent reductase (Old Yellow Enzyme family)